MLIIPAIDIQSGCVVRLVQGKRDRKIYSRDPLKTAKHWVKQGARLLHVVDLDGAFTGAPANIAAAAKIASEAGIPVEFGGGVRSAATIRTLVNSGVSRIILGTRAVEDTSFLKKAFAEFGDKIIVSIDARAQSVAVKGWKDTAAKTDLLTFAGLLREIGFKEVIYTDTLKDGMLKGPNIAVTKKLLKNTGLGVIASGGISSLDDIRKLKALEPLGLTGVIVGKALYEGRFTLQAAMKIV